MLLEALNMDFYPLRLYKSFQSVTFGILTNILWQKRIFSNKTRLNSLISDVLENSNNEALNYKQVSAKLNIKDDEARETILEILKEQAHKGVFAEPQKENSSLKI